MEWLSAAEVVDFKLPGLPETERAIQIRAARENWNFRPRQGRGGGKEYHVQSLPPEAQKALTRRAVSSVAPSAAPPVMTINPLYAKDWQKEVMTGRAVVLAEIERMRTEGGISQADAIDALVNLAQTGELPDWLRDAADAANLRRRKGAPVLSRPTLYRWIKAKNERTINALIPRPARERMDYPWADALMQAYSLPSKPTLAACLEVRVPALLPAGVALPTYAQARRYLEKLPFHTRNKGRIGPKEMRANRAYVSRDISGIEAGWIYIGDGHTYKALVAHPIHGRPFRPEITTIIDVATRMVVGWSVALSENTLAVADALRTAATYSVPAIFYYDNGSGANNQIWDDAATGLIARLGITKMNSIPGNSQSRGVIEHFHSTVLHKAAKWLPSYVGKDMDPDARFLQDRMLRRDVAETGTSKILPTWGEFIRYLTGVYDAYNNRPHSTLPRIGDPATGKKRNMTPAERWADSVASGVQLFPLSETEAAAEFRPTIIRKCNRAIVKLFGNEYFSLYLEPYHQCDVQVAYDVRDGSRIWVSDAEGRFICEAQADGNKRSYQPKSAERYALENRVANRRLRAEKKLGIIDLELPPLEIAYQSEAALPIDHAAAEAEWNKIAPQPLALPEPAPRSGRPMFANDIDWVQWLIANPDEITEQDKGALCDCLRKPSFLMEIEMAGVAPAALSELATQKAKVA